MLWKWSKKEQKISVSSFLMCLIMQAIIFITVKEEEILKMLIMIRHPKKNTQDMYIIQNTWSLGVKTSTQMKYNLLVFYML